MKKLLTGLAIGLCGLLSACFVSETRFIADKDIVTLPEGKVSFCSSKDECAEADPQEDGSYLLIPPPDEDDPPMPVRLALLTQNDLGQIWLAEFEMTEDDETLYVAGVVRRASEFDGDLPAYEVALPDCSDVTEEEAATYGINKIDKGTCALPTETSIADYLTGGFADRLNDPQWWEDND